ncbi:MULTISPECIES: tetratricopeptide repeat protein [unclassified Hyphomicrobium]|uniref:tetratricopeptide repeat protein n=1 Tax=unclassified Hyphomicrobium TaxID=2619925 RepID=UPI000213F793|nr:MULTISPECIES: tetratricopeptide repeat protein [unclassified Hyphomicrobium]CCB63744.1 Tetratricopeptide TPR_2 repeat protein [Hyphomicrobium sp. MC1]
MKLANNRLTIAAAAITAVIASGFVSHAKAAPAAKSHFDEDVLSVANDWARVKYLSKSNDERQRNMDAVGAKADELAQRYPDQPEALIWDGIVTSERASLTWGIGALNLASKARDVLLKAESLNPKAADAGAPTSLGVLYYRVPGFPFGWGDKDKARAYLEEAVKNAPNGRDAHYFYADFLYEQGEYKAAEYELKQGLSSPAHPERPIWNTYFPKVMQGLLAKVQEKERS